MKSIIDPDGFRVPLMDLAWNRKKPMSRRYLVSRRDRPSIYVPHQGTKEMARRAKRMGSEA